MKTFLRMLDTYNFNTKKVQTVIRLREGEWVPVGKAWKHLSGSFLNTNYHELNELWRYF